jgi:hypothetical protein
MQYYVAVDKLLTYGFCLEVVDLQLSHTGPGFATCGEPKHTVADPAHKTLLSRFNLMSASGLPSWRRLPNYTVTHSRRIVFHLRKFL